MNEILSSLIYALSGSRYLDHLGMSQLLLTPWSRFLPEQLRNPQLVKKFPALFGIGRFIAAFTSACHLPQQYIPSSPSHFFKIHFKIILPSIPLSSKWYIFIGFSHQNHLCNSSVPHPCHMRLLSHPSCFDHVSIIGCRFQIITLLVM